MNPRQLYFIVPGPLEQRTGGYLYDARMVDGLRRLGWRVSVRNLVGSFPDADRTAHDSLSQALESVPDGGKVVVDGLAMGGLPDPIGEHGQRVRILSLVHHPLADETGLSEADGRRLMGSEREALSHCAGVIVTSEFTAGRVEKYGVPASRIRAIVPGTEPASRAAGPGPGEPPRLVCVGTITPRKGYEVLVGGLEQVADLPWTCVCAGAADRDPTYAEGVFAQVAAAGLQDRIEFVDELDRGALDAVYDSGSIFVLASYYEGYGMALTEALAHGLPIVSTTGGAIPFTVPRDAGVFVEPGDADGLAQALRPLLATGSPSLAELATAARRRAAELPDWDDAVRAFGTAVEELGG